MRPFFTVGCPDIKTHSDWLVPRQLEWVRGWRVKVERQGKVPCSAEHKVATDGDIKQYSPG